MGYKIPKYKNIKIVRYLDGRKIDYGILKETVNYKSMLKKEKDTWRKIIKDTAVVFDSIKECEYYEYLLDLELKGKLFEIRLQPIYILQEKDKELGLSVITYKADFEFKNKNGEIIVVDVKGMPTAIAKIKRKMFMYVHRDKQLLWVCWATKSLGWMDYFDNEKRKKENRAQKAEKKLQT